MVKLRIRMHSHSLYTALQREKVRRKKLEVAGAARARPGTQGKSVWGANTTALVKFLFLWTPLLFFHALGPAGRGLRSECRPEKYLAEEVEQTCLHLVTMATVLRVTSLDDLHCKPRLEPGTAELDVLGGEIDLQELLASSEGVKHGYTLILPNTEKRRQKVRANSQSYPP